jgi:hypothetical protein
MTLPTSTTNQSTHRVSSDQEIIDHYARMALMPGAVDHARYQVMQMEKHPTKMYRGLGKAVKERMDELNDLSNKLQN